MKKINKFWYILTAFLFCIGALIGVVADWLADNFTTGIQEILFTVNTIDGGNTDVVARGFKACLPVILVVWTIIIAVLVLDYKKRIQIVLIGKIFRFSCKIRLSKWLRILGLFLSLLCVAWSLSALDGALHVSDYYRLKASLTEIYDTHYVSPESVEITAKQNPKNLVLIYLESMESGYASKDEGGEQNVNLIPNLTAMAKENVSFSNSDKLGGFISMTGTTWTVGALYASVSGVPFAFDVDSNSMSEKKYFAPGIQTLGDVLEEKGYVQEFLCGSDAKFGGRDKLYKQHGNHKIFDLFTARKKGYIPADYYVWWGYEDEILYDIAKDELVNLSQSGKPFSLSMLTVDTHFTDGYVCNTCDNTYETVAENVVACADRQIEDFMNWCEQQPFYEDTVFVIVGDHPRMDVCLTGHLPYSERPVYNCFINAVPPKPSNTQNRMFTTMDLFPTVLSAMGFEIENQQLGLGVNMFSGEPTLLETMGYNVLNEEFAKNSIYYQAVFDPVQE